MKHPCFVNFDSTISDGFRRPWTKNLKIRCAYIWDLKLSYLIWKTRWEVTFGTPCIPREKNLVWCKLCPGEECPRPTRLFELLIYASMPVRIPRFVERDNPTADAATSRLFDQPSLYKQSDCLLAIEENPLNLSHWWNRSTEDQPKITLTLKLH